MIGPSLPLTSSPRFTIYFRIHSHAYGRRPLLYSRRPSHQPAYERYSVFLILDYLTTLQLCLHCGRVSVASTILLQSPWRTLEICTIRKLIHYRSVLYINLSLAVHASVCGCPELQLCEICVTSLSHACTVINRHVKHRNMIEKLCHLYTAE